MPAKGKVTKEVPTIRELAKEMESESVTEVAIMGEDSVFLDGKIVGRIIFDPPMEMEDGDTILCIDDEIINVVSADGMEKSSHKYRVEREPDAIMTGEPEDAEQTSTEEPLVEDAHGVIQEAPAPLLSLSLVRRGALLTDIGDTVHIPAPAILKEGERVRVVVYREA